jgi:hypothetical protein
VRRSQTTNPDDRILRLSRPKCGEQADAPSCGHCGAATDQETPVDEAETIALPVPETSDAKYPKDRID